MLLRAVAASLLATMLLSCAASSPRAAENGATPLRTASYNIRHGAGMDNRVDLPRTASVLRALSADVIGLQEVDHRVTRSGSVAQMDSLGRLLGMQAAFGAFMPYQGGEYGLGILSRHPISRMHTIRLPDGNEPRVALLVDIVVAGRDTVSVVNVHFDWVGNDTLRYAQASALARVLDTLRTPYVLLGDFNDEPGSRTLALFSARATEAQKPADNHFTFSSTAPSKEIDFIFAAPSVRWTSGGARVIDERVASDHRPVVADWILRAR